MSPQRPLDAVFSPRSIAVVGASRNPASIGYALLHNLVLGGFTGPLYPVNPEARSIHTLPCYPNLTVLPEAPDLVVVLVPRDAVLPVVDQAIARGARALVVISAGFGETGGEGAALEARLRERVRAAGVRMIGPNCMGVINTDDEVRMNATVEVLRDVRFAVTPLSRPEAAATIRGIQGVRLLEGVRGDAPADFARLEEVLLRLAQLVTRHARIVELDLNPFLAAPEGGPSAALDVRIRVAAATAPGG